MKNNDERLSRERARELLDGLASAVGGGKGKVARESVARFLNSAVPGYNWVGVYTVQGKDLVLDAWSGPAPTIHTRIPLGKGVCGYAAKSGKTEIVSDVSKDPRYLECFVSTKSEIVVPIANAGTVIGEIDVDSDRLDMFSSLDREFLEAVARKLAMVW